MAVLVAEFFGIVGVDMVAPATMAELIPWILQVVVGLTLVSGVFRVIGKLADLFVNWRRF